MHRKKMYPLIHLQVTRRIQLQPTLNLESVGPYLHLQHTLEERTKPAAMWNKVNQTLILYNLRDKFFVFGHAMDKMITLE